MVNVMWQSQRPMPDANPICRRGVLAGALNPSLATFMDISQARRVKAAALFQMADLDYIAFRHLAKLETAPAGMLLFAAAQTLEKYMKAALLTAGASVHDLSHDLSDAWLRLKTNQVTSGLVSQFQDSHLSLCESCAKQFKSSDHARYLASDMVVSGNEHHRIDRAVLRVLRPLVTLLSMQSKTQPPTGVIDSLKSVAASPWQHAYSALHSDNHALHPDLVDAETITHIQHMRYSIPLIVVKNQVTVNKKRVIEEHLGYKMSQSEFNMTFVVDEADFGAAKTNTDGSDAQLQQYLATQRQRAT